MGRGRVVVVAGWLAVLLAVTQGAIGCAPRKARRATPLRPAALGPGWPRPDVLDLAVRAWRCGRERGEFDSSLLTVIDYSLPSTEPRLWVIDVPARRVVYHELVAHGEGSGENQAVAFSNIPGSRQSSLGLFRTEDTYVGGNGYSLRLMGLEPGVNDLAMERKIVMHGADYVDAEFVAALGRLGRSHGCPALAPEVARTVIDEIKGGSAVFAYYPDRTWIETSSFLRCDGVRVAGR